MGSSVSRPTGRTSFSVISANASAALRCRSTLSENERVVRAVKGEPVKKFVVVRSVGRVSLRENVCREAGAPHSPGTAEDPPLPPARSQAVMAHTIATCARGLQRLLVSGGRADRVGQNIQHESQQLVVFPIDEECK